MGSEDDRLLDVGDVAAMLKVDDETVRRWLRKGTLKGFRLGGRKSGWRTRASDLDAFIAGASGREKGKSPT